MGSRRAVEDGEERAESSPRAEPTATSKELVSGGGTQSPVRRDSATALSSNAASTVNRETPKLDGPTRTIDCASRPQQQHQAPLHKAGGQYSNINSNGNSYSGLNLNMTASEMRELLARRKKFDPKKAQMNIRQKYEIIQQM